MTFSEYSNEDHRAKAVAILASLGNFVVAFERVCAAMRHCIFASFRREGLKNQGLSQVVVNGKAAAFLRETLGAVYAELPDQDEKDRVCVKSVLARVASLATRRNEFLHAEWYTNYDYDGATDEFNALALKYGSSQSDGAFTIPISVNEATLRDSLREATEIQVLLNRLAICLNQKGHKVSEHLNRPL